MKKSQLMKQLDNIWYHYKTRIIIGFVIIAIIIPLLIFDKDSKPSALNIIVIGNTIPQTEQKLFQEKASKNILGENSTKEINVDFWGLDGNLSSRQNMDLYQKLLAKVSTKEVDILIIDKGDFILLDKQGAFKTMNLSQINLIEGKKGIDLNGNNLLSKTGFNSENKVLGILSNTQHTKLAKQFIQWLLQSD